MCPVEAGLRPLAYCATLFSRRWTRRTRALAQTATITSEDSAAIAGADLMPAYMIVQIKITREEAWPEYREQVSKLFAQHGGRYLVRGWSGRGA